MEVIIDLKAYLTRMDAALLDKCWWIDKISSNIDTVIDFGCAAGHLKDMIEHLAPNTYKYIGVDSSEEMRRECAQRNITVYSFIDEAMAQCNPKTTILVMNSVIHEILSYSDTYMSLFHTLAAYDCHYVAIRDMFAGEPHFSDEQFNNMLYAIHNSIYKAQLEQFYKCAQHRYHVPSQDLILKEFLLKYWYTENWDRECQEQYLWDWDRLIKYAFTHYRVKSVEQFYIPYVRDKIYKDFHFEYNENTHVKLLLEIDDKRLRYNK